jgi:hypothetical protein
MATEDQRPRYSLRALFVLVTACAVGLAACSGIAGFIEREWNEPVRVGQAANARFKALFAKRGWAGYGAAFFYDGRVRIASASIGDKELPELVPILREIPWLRHIELYETTITPQGLADLQRQFPGCHLSIDRP